jgi:hypothetical protein
MKTSRVISFWPFKTISGPDYLFSSKPKLAMRSQFQLSSLTSIPYNYLQNVIPMYIQVARNVGIVAGNDHHLVQPGVAASIILTSYYSTEVKEVLCCCGFDMQPYLVDSGILGASDGSKCILVPVAPHR